MEYKQKESVKIVFTGDGKGKTSAGIGLVCRSLGNGDSVAFIQFIKAWHVSEHSFLDEIKSIYGDKLFFYRGGRGFYNAGSMSAKDVSQEDHQASAKQTYQKARDAVSSGEYALVVCDEINNAVHDGLIGMDDMEWLLLNCHPKTSICLTGRGFPMKLLGRIDILTDMTKVRHHYDEGFIAQKGIDY